MRLRLAGCRHGIVRLKGTELTKRGKWKIVGAGQRDGIGTNFKDGLQESWKV